MDDYTPTQRRLVLIAAICASSMGFIDGSVVSIVTPAIRSALGASLPEAQWVTDGYLLTLSSLLLIAGAAGDRYGLRRVFAGGIVLFVIASMVCAAAPSPAFLIGARVVQGLGAAFMVPGSLAIIAAAYPEEQRGGAIGIWAAASSLTTLLGPVLGGALLSLAGDASWRFVFVLNLPLGAIALLLLRAAPAIAPSAARPLDILGAVLATLALLLISGALIEAASPLFVVALVAGFAVAAIFLFVEARSSSPMLPLNLFVDPRFSAAQAATFLIYFGLSAVTFYLPTLLIAGWRVSPAEVAIAMLPLGIVLTILSGPAGRLVDRTGPEPVLIAGALVVALAFAALGFAVRSHSLWFAVLPLMVLFGVGMSAIAGPISTAVMAAAPRGTTGTASAINNAVARVAGLLAISLMGSVAALVYAQIAGPAVTATFGAEIGTNAISPDADATRMLASDFAFAAIAWTSAALSLVAALIIWLALRRRKRTSP